MPYSDSDIESMAVDGQIVRQAIERNVSIHRFALAVDEDRWMFGGESAATLADAYLKYREKHDPKAEVVA